MKKRILLAVLCIFFAFKNYAQICLLPKAYQDLFTGIAIVSEKTYKNWKSLNGKPLSLAAYIPCDNTYRFFARRDSTEYEMFYTPGDTSFMFVTFRDAKQEIEQHHIIGSQTSAVIDRLLCKGFRYRCTK